MLTNVREVTDRSGMVQLMVTQHTTALQQSSLYFATRTAEQISQLQLPLFDASGLLRAYRIRQWAEMLPALRAVEAPVQVPSLLEFGTDEEIALHRLRKPRVTEQQERIMRYAQLKPQETMAEVERLKLERDAIFHVELIALALLEYLLWTTRQFDVQQVLTQLLEMSQARRSWLTPILGKESLQKLMLTLYVPYFMETPLRHNMLGLMVSWLTMQALTGKSVSGYASMAGQGQQMKQKSELLSCEARIPRQKAVALSKKLTEWWQTVVGLFETLDFKLSSQVPLFTDWKGRPLRTVTLLNVLGHNYLISKNFTLSTGFPENKWYMVYPRLEVIVTRRGLRLHKRLTVPESQAFNYRRDNYVRDMRKWRSWHG